MLSTAHAVVACDLFLDLRLYCVPQWLMDQLSEAFPNVLFQPVNVPGASLLDSSATVYWGNRITPEIIGGMPYLRWIHFGSVGVDRARTPEVRERNIMVTSSRGTVVAPMVASALAFMASLARGLHRSEALRRSGGMNRKSFDAYFDQIRELAGERCLIVGYGDVGQRLGRVCRALDMDVVAIRRPGKEACSELSESYPIEKLADAASTADYVVNLLPYTAHTERVFDRAFFSAMKPDAFFINIGRGETVDEDALIDVLAEDGIAGAGLDVFAVEPLTPDSPLWNMPNVMLTPHVAALGERYWERQAALFSHNLHCYLERDIKGIRNVVDMSSGY